MRVLAIWQNCDVNPGLSVIRTLRAMGHTVRICTNPFGDVITKPTGALSEVLPKCDIPIFKDELDKFIAAGDNDEKHIWTVPWMRVIRTWDKLESSMPDFVLVFEGALGVGGDFPDSWQGIPILYWGFDQGRGADYEMRQAFAARATHILVMCRWYLEYFRIKRHISYELMPGLSKSGCCFEKTYWMPACCNGVFFHPYPEEEKQYDVYFSGTPGLKIGQPQEDDSPAPVAWVKNAAMSYEFNDGIAKVERSDTKFNEWCQRAEMLRLLIQEKAFKFVYRPAAFYGEYGRELARARIVWNCQGGREATHYGTTNRPFQGAAVGSCVMTNRSDEIGDLFIPDQEIITYPLSYSPDHPMFKWFDYALMRDKILDILSNEQRMRDIGEAGRQRVLAQHMPIHRAQRILDIAQGKSVDANSLEVSE